MNNNVATLTSLVGWISPAAINDIRRHLVQTTYDAGFWHGQRDAKAGILPPTHRYSATYMRGYRDAIRAARA